MSEATGQEEETRARAPSPPVPPQLSWSFRRCPGSPPGRTCSHLPHRQRGFSPILDCKAHLAGDSVAPPIEGPEVTRAARGPAGSPPPRHPGLARGRRGRRGPPGTRSRGSSLGRAGGVPSRLGWRVGSQVSGVSGGPGVLLGCLLSPPASRGLVRPRFQGSQGAGEGASRKSKTRDQLK